MTKTLHCLIVDDSEDDALLVVAELQRCGYDVPWECVDTAEAMRCALDRQPWDVVLCDYQMPRFSGLAALELLKATGRDLPFIIVSGTIGEDIAVAIMKAGAHDYIMKGKLARLVPAVEREMREAAGRCERRRAETALAMERDMMTNLLKTIPDNIYFKNRQSRFLRINNKMSLFFGLRSPSEAVGKSDFDFFSEEHARQAYDDEQRVMSTGEPIIGIEEKETWPDGRITWVSTTKVALRDADGSFTGLVGISRDITERKKEEEALRLAEQKYRSIFDNAVEGIFQRARGKIARRQRGPGAHLWLCLARGTHGQQDGSRAAGLCRSGAPRGDSSGSWRNREPLTASSMRRGTRTAARSGSRKTCGRCATLVAGLSATKGRCRISPSASRPRNTCASKRPCSRQPATPSI